MMKNNIQTNIPENKTAARFKFNEGWLSTGLLILALASAAFLRIWQINAMGLNSDEAVYAGQAAAIAGVPVLEDIFPIFRAHPLLFQFLLSVIYTQQFSDVAGRLLSAVIGIGTVYVTYLLGKEVYGRLPGAIAALILAVMPYHVIVTRQILLDGPMVFFATVTLYLLARYSKTEKVAWLYATGASMGLTFLGKETSIIIMGGFYIYFALAPEVRVKIKDLFISTIIMALVIAPFPISLMLAGGTSSGRNYLVWQLFRRPNHEWPFYAQVVPPAIGWLVVIAAIAGFIILWKERSWREKLLVSWIIVPIVFFQIWPVKGFQYLLPIAPPVAVLAGRLLGNLVKRETPIELHISDKNFKIRPIHTWLAVGVMILALGFSSWQRIQPEISSLFLAGTGGVPGGREAGTWISEYVPEQAVFMTIGPSMGNIIKFYGQRDAYGLSVSPNPLHRNPSYVPIDNPDFQIRNANIQYLVWDSFSASRSTFFSDKLLGYVNKYNGRAVHTESITVQDADGNDTLVPVIIIYEVFP